MIRNLRSAVVLSIAILTGSMMGAAQSAQPQAAQPDATPQAAPAAAQAPESAIPVDQQATKEQLAKLFEVMRIKQQMDAMMKMMPALIEQQMKTQMNAIKAKLPNGKQISPEEQAAIDKLMSKEADRAMHIVSFDDMINDLTEVYQHHISRTDADAFIAFYSSPAGQHLLDEQPAIMKEYMPKVMAHANEKTQELTEQMMKDVANLTKQYEQPAKTAAPK
jgi:hypothetical protein